MKIGPVRSMKISFLIGMIGLMFKNINKYGFYSPENLAFFIVVSIFIILDTVRVKVARAISKSIGYISTEKQTFISPDGKNTLIVQKNFVYKPFLYLNGQLVFEGNKVIDSAITISQVTVNWIDNDNCNVILSTKFDPNYIELKYNVKYIFYRILTIR